MISAIHASDLRQRRIGRPVFQRDPVFGTPASGHFGSQAIHGVVREVELKQHPL
jgi:hypothetical protein